MKRLVGLRLPTLLIGAALIFTGSSLSASNGATPPDGPGPTLTSPPPATTSLAPLAAVNELQSIPWSDFSTQSVRDAKAQVEALNGQVLAQKTRTCYGIGACIAYKMWMTDIQFTGNLSASPGLRYACLQQGDCPGDPVGFRVELPLNDSWSIHVDANVHTDASVWGVVPVVSGLYIGPVPVYLKCCATKTLSIDLTNIKFTQAARLNAAEQDRPTLTDASVTGHMTLQMHGVIYTYQPVELNFSVSVTDGQIQFSSPPSIDAGVRLIDLGGAEIPGKLHDVKLELNYDPNKEQVSVRTSGTFDVELVQVFGMTFSIPDSFHNTVTTPVPSGLLQALAAGIPRAWGENPPAAAWTKPVAHVDFA
ncbi:MAG: hypothetical protein WB444_05375, partial [Gallionella sp.]